MVSDAEANHLHHGTTNDPLYRLAAVIVNPYSNAVGTLERIDPEQWRQSFDTNVMGAVITSQKFLPTVWTSSYCRIVRMFCL